MPGDAVVEGGKDTLPNAGSVKCIAEMGVAFRLFVEVGTRPSVAVVAAHHDALAENGGEDLSIVAVDTEDVTV